MAFGGKTPKAASFILKYEYCTIVHTMFKKYSLAQQR